MFHCAPELRNALKTHQWTWTLQWKRGKKQKGCHDDKHGSGILFLVLFFSFGPTHRARYCKPNPSKSLRQVHDVLLSNVPGKKKTQIKTQQFVDWRAQNLTETTAVPCDFFFARGAAGGLMLTLCRSRLRIFTTNESRITFSKREQGHLAPRGGLGSSHLRVKLSWRYRGFAHLTAKAARSQSDRINLLKW